MEPRAHPVGPGGVRRAAAGPLAWGLTTRTLMRPLLVALVAALTVTGCSSVQSALEAASAPPATRTASSSAPAARTASAATRVEASTAPDPELQPSAELRSSMDCLGARPVRVESGTIADYTWRNGFETTDQPGFLERKDVTAAFASDCYLDLSADPTAERHYLLTFNRSDIPELGAGYEMQCVRSQNPGAGVIKTGAYSPVFMNRIQPKHILLRGPNDTGYDSVDGENNGRRSDIYKARMEEQGLIQFGIKAEQVRATNDAIGETAFCAFMNTSTGKTLFATEYVVTTYE